MREKDVYLLRRVRREIVAICRKICLQEWTIVGKCWETLELELTDSVLLKVIHGNFLDECRACIVRKNYLRLYDLLRYEIDLDIADCLSHLSKEDRMEMSENARKKNEEVLSIHYKKIFESIQKVGESVRITFSYTGTENVNIFVREEEYQFQLFSSENPWLESANFADGIERDKLDEICVLGFGGGYLIQELERRFKHAKIKVYLPNIDIFKAVIDSIPVYEILQSKNLELYLDYTGLVFFLEVRENIEQGRNFSFYIDRQELRALVRNAAHADKLIQDSKYRGQIENLPINRDEELIGEKIEKYIKNFSADS